MNDYKEVQYNSFFDVFFWSIMVGIGESFMGAFTLSYGFSERFAGLVVIIPFGIASIAQVFSPTVFQKFKIQKNIVIFCSLMQSICLFLLLIQPKLYKGSNEGLIFILTCYWYFALSAGPPWNAWIVSLIPKKQLRFFFSKRGVIQQITLIISLVTGGLILAKNDGSISAFSILFFIAGIARLTSTYFLWKHPVGEDVFEYSKPDDLKSFINWIKNKNVIGIISFVGIFRFGVAIASPFFTPFVLKQLNINYEIYTLIILTPFISRALAFNFGGKILHLYGIQRSLVFSLFLISLLPFLWTINPGAITLLGCQVLSGVGWAIFEYAILFRQIEDFKKVERSRVLTWTNFIIGVCTISGVLTGSTILGKNPSIESYESIFYLSSLFRISPIIFIFFIDWKSTRIYSMNYFFRIIGIKPNRGGEVKPVLYTKENQDSE